MSGPPLRLGFAVKVIGRPGMKSNDSRGWQNKPHLKVCIGFLHAIFDYLARARGEHVPDVLGHRALCQAPGPAAVSPDGARKRRRFGGARRKGEKPRSAPVVSSFAVRPAEQLGGVYGDHQSSRARWVKNWQRLPQHVKRRLVLENDDVRFSAADVLWVHEHTGVRLVFDYQHFWCLNPERLDMVDTLRRMLRTWPDGERPKIHFSTPRTELREVQRAERGTKKTRTVKQPPIWTRHADFANPFEFVRFMRDAQGLVFDVMLEHPGLYPPQLLFQPDAAGLQLALRRRLVQPALAAQLPLEVLDRVGDINRVALHARRGERTVEHLARGSDEGQALEVLLVNASISARAQLAVLADRVLVARGARLDQGIEPPHGASRGIPVLGLLDVHA